LPASFFDTEDTVVERRDVEFEVERGDRLRGWLFTPDAGTLSCPAISMAHGYALVKEQGLERFALALAGAGFVVLVHDHRNFGASDGLSTPNPPSPGWKHYYILQSLAV